MSATNAEELSDSEQVSTGQNFSRRLRGCDNDARHACYLGQYSCHQQRGCERISPGRNITADRFERPNDPAEFPAGGKFPEAFTRHLGHGEFSDVCDGGFGSNEEFRGDLLCRRRNLFLAHAQGQIAEAVEFACVAQKRLVLLRSYIINDGANQFILGDGEGSMRLKEVRPALIKNSNHNAPLHHNLVQRIFDNSLRSGLFEARDDVAHGGLFEDGVHRDPVFIA